MSFPDGKISLIERIDQVFTSDGVELFRNAKRELWALEAQRATVRCGRGNGTKFGRKVEVFLWFYMLL